MIAEFNRPRTGEHVLVHLKEHSLVLMVDAREVFTFDAAGRLLYAVCGGEMFHRGMDNRLLRAGRGGGILGAKESEPYLRRIYSEVRALRRHAPPAARQALEPASRVALGTLRSDAARFSAIYGSVPILPPDQYAAVYLQVTLGCATNRCGFCTLYRDRPFRIRTYDEFSRHLRDVLALLGPDAERRRTIFLGDANALTVPMPDLRFMMRVARAALPARDFFAFVDATMHRRKTVAELDELRRLGLRRVTLGLETAHEPLYSLMGKPGSSADALTTLRFVRAARLNVGLTVLVGLGGSAYFEEHVEDTVRFLEEQELGDGDFVYLSALRPDKGSDYAAWVAENPERLLDSAGREQQMRIFRERLSPSLGRRGVKIAAYDLSRFIY